MDVSSLNEVQKTIFWLIGATEELHRLGILTEPDILVAQEHKVAWRLLDENRSSLSLFNVSRFAKVHAEKLTGTRQDAEAIESLIMLFYSERTELLRAYCEDLFEIPTG